MRWLLLILSACSLVAQSVGRITTSTNGLIQVTWTNIYPCSIVEVSPDLKSWTNYLRVEAYFEPESQFNYVLKPGQGKWFWRLKPCP
jgi:hypothetical protein